MKRETEEKIAEGVLTVILVVLVAGVVIFGVVMLFNRIGNSAFYKRGQTIEAQTKKLEQQQQTIHDQTVFINKLRQTEVK